MKSRSIAPLSLFAAGLALAPAAALRGQSPGSNAATAAGQMQGLGPQPGEGAHRQQREQADSDGYSEAGGATPLNREAARQISGRFSTIAGSDENADQLVAGLRDGTTIALTTADGQTVRITPECGRLGYGNAVVVLGLAQEELAKLGVSHPTLQQLEVILDGGTISVNGRATEVEGLLRLCSSGDQAQDWDRVATRIGVDPAPAKQAWANMEARIEHGGQIRIEDRDRLGNEKGTSGGHRIYGNPKGGPSSQEARDTER